MNEKPIDVARRVVRRAFLKVESLERRDCPSHLLPHHHAVHAVHRVALIHTAPVPSTGDVFHKEDFMPSASKPVPVGQKPTYSPEWIDIGGALRVIAGGVPFIPGGPINPPIVVAPVPLPAAPAPAPANPPAVAH